MMLSTREIQRPDVEHLVRYWTESPHDHLIGMGVDISQMPSEAQMSAAISAQLTQNYREKQAYCIIWLLDNEPVGHSNINKIIFGESAAMHLHLWTSGLRAKGMGAQFVRLTVPYFFNHLDLKLLYSEPNAFNPAPNKTLPKAGFELAKTYTTIPGSINFEQVVNRWELPVEKWKNGQFL